MVDGPAPLIRPRAASSRSERDHDRTKGVKDLPPDAALLSFGSLLAVLMVAAGFWRRRSDDVRLGI